MGVPTGAVLVLLWTTAGSDNPCKDYPAACAAGGAAVVGVTGALVGLGIGALSKSERWEDVPLDRLRVSIVPLPDGRLAFGLSVVF